MPYRINPKVRTEVQVKRKGRWVRYRIYYGRGARRKALDLLAALRINVMGKEM